MRASRVGVGSIDLQSGDPSMSPIVSRVRLPARGLGGETELSTRGLIRRILASILILSLIAGAGGIYFILRHRALEAAADKARLMLVTALAIRAYTTEQIQPDLPQFTTDKFHAATVPSFAAQTVYRKVQTNFPAYTYREPALNPTNPADRATPFEVELINKFRSDAEIPELHGVRSNDGASVFYLARPIKITQEACLACHSTPDRAPAAMLAKYGSANGFGWTLNETIGIQTLTVPVEQELRSAMEVAVLVAGGLLLLFLVIYWALTASLNMAVVRPLVALARAADVASKSGEPGVKMPRSGAEEIRTLTEAIERLRASLFKALNQLTARPSTGPR